MRVLFCESCGGPLEAPWRDLAVVCPHCGAHNLPGQPGAWSAPRAPADGRPRLNLGGRTYLVEGRLGQGASSVVYRARWVVRLGELVVLKVLAATADRDLFRREWDTLVALQASHAEGAAHFTTRLPVPVAHGLIESDRPRPASVFGWKSGFVHTLEQVGEVHSGGVRGEVMVWVLKRLLELLGFVHRAGFVHGAVTPEHVLVHPRDHGATLVGWTLATPWRPGHTRPLPATNRRWATFYGGATEATPALDLAMAARCAQAIAGWHLPGVTRPAPLQRVLDAALSGRREDAWALAEELTAASAEAFGPPAYHPLAMPGWEA
ncbi:MAG: hypothetical protein JXX28_01575 [Deltaproteobacteria bacterium]|nr:hypothetical protein [Deltaproteobacteria bacterium]